MRYQQSRFANAPPISSGRHTRTNVWRDCLTCHTNLSKVFVLAASNCNVTALLPSSAIAELGSLLLPRCCDTVEYAIVMSTSLCQGSKLGWKTHSFALAESSAKFDGYATYFRFSCAQRSTPKTSIPLWALNVL